MKCFECGREQDTGYKVSQTNSETKEQRVIFLCKQCLWLTKLLEASRN